MSHGLCDAAREIDQHGVSLHQHRARPDHEQVGLLDGAAQFDRVQQRGVRARQTRQLPRVVMVTAMAAPGHRFQLARVGHNRIVAYLFNHLANYVECPPVSSATRAPGDLADR